LKAGGESFFVASQNLPDFHPRTVLRDWENGEAFHLADALTGVCVLVRRAALHHMNTNLVDLKMQV
jgi:hypothetical protein